MADKTFKIAAVYDNQGLKNLQKDIKNLELSARNINKSFREWNLTATTGQAKFSKELLNTNKSLDKFNRMSKDTARVIRDDYNKSIQAARGQLDALNKRLVQYNQTYSKIGGMISTATGDRRDRLIKGQAAVMGRIVGAEAKRQDLIKELEGPATSLAKKVLAGLAVGGVIGALELAQQYKTAELTNIASGLAPFNALARPGGGVAAGLVATPQGREDISKASGRNLPIAKEAAKILGGATIAYFGGSAGWAAGGAMAASGAWNLLTGKPARTAAESVQKAISAQVETNPLGSMMLNDIYSNAGMRVMANRRLGGVTNAQRAQGIGVGLGMDEGTAYQMAGQLTGMTGQNRAPAMMSGLSNLIRAGIGQEISARMLTGFAQASDIQNQSAQKAATKARQYVDSILAAGLVMTGGDRVMAEKMGNFIAQNLVTPMGGRISGFGGAGFGQLMMRAMGPNPDMVSVGATQTALGSINNMMSGKAGGLFAAVGLANARKVLGGGASGSALLALSGMNLQDLLAASQGKSDVANAFHISKTQARAAMNKMGGAFGAYLGLDKEFQNKLQASGVDISKVMKGYMGDKMAQTRLSVEMVAAGLAPDRTSALHEMRLFAGIDDAFMTSAHEKRVRKKLGIKDIGGGVDLAAAQTVAKNGIILREKENQSIKDLIPAIQNFTAQLIATTEAGEAALHQTVPLEDIEKITQDAKEKGLVNQKLVDYVKDQIYMKSHHGAMPVHREHSHHNSHHTTSHK